MKKKRKKYPLTDEQKAQKKIYQAKWWEENKEAQKIKQANWYQDNKEEVKRQGKEWSEANPEKVKAKNDKFKENNPGYFKEHSHKHDLGYWIVYIIHDYNGRGDEYCGMTQNIHARMNKHKSLGKLNTDAYTIVKKCDTLEDALEIESAVHNFGYHGSVSTESGK